MGMGDGVLLHNGPAQMAVAAKVLRTGAVRKRVRMGVKSGMRPETP